MEEVVYIIGAGFSAVAGLPVMSNFLEKAKDIYLREPETYAHFKSVIDYINDLSFIKNYYSADLFNIEEILSIIEMAESVGGKDEIGFKKFIKDTIEYYTPENIPVDPKQINHMNFLGTYVVPKSIGAFVLSLTNISYKAKRVLLDGYTTEQGFKIEFFKNDSIRNIYSIITLNYDRVIESVFDFVDKHPSLKKNSDNLFFEKETGLSLFKLHGSVDTEIIPPTWNKILNDNVKSQWEGAFEALKKAKHIRILGYSLPESDSYIKYLFKAAIAENKYLKTIDIICLDQSGSVEERYEGFIKYPNKRFKNADLFDYIKEFERNLQRPHIIDLANKNQTKQLAICESVHNSFMEN